VKYYLRLGLAIFPLGAMAGVSRLYRMCTGQIPVRVELAIERVIEWVEEAEEP